MQVLRKIERYCAYAEFKKPDAFFEKQLCIFYRKIKNLKSGKSKAVFLRKSLEEINKKIIKFTRYTMHWGLKLIGI